MRLQPNSSMTSSTDSRELRLLVVFQRKTAAFPDGLEAREVNDGVDRMRSEDSAQKRLVAHVAAIEYGRNARDCLDLLRHVRRSVGKIVRDNDRMSGLDQLDAGVASDEARAAGYKNCHFSVLLMDID